MFSTGLPFNTIVMIIIQDKNKDIIGIGRTLPKTLANAGIPPVKYSYIKQSIASHGVGVVFKYKDYFISKWVI
jgi:hypothetical protein